MCEIQLTGFAGLWFDREKASDEVLAVHSGGGIPPLLQNSVFEVPPKRPKNVHNYYIDSWYFPQFEILRTNFSKAFFEI